jgi:[ribosomal protein S5]-alanine N-acetyltransferase
VPILETARLVLVPCDARLTAVERDPAALAAAVGAAVPADWPPAEIVPALGAWHDELTRHPERCGWYGWLWVLRDGPLIGQGGFKGEPGADGAIEIGYAVVPSQQRRGYATEAVNALVAWAKRDPRVRRIDAETTSAASARLLRKLGFRELPQIAADVLRFSK